MKKITRFGEMNPYNYYYQYGKGNNLEYYTPGAYILLENTHVYNSDFNILLNHWDIYEAPDPVIPPQPIEPENGRIYEVEIVGTDKRKIIYYIDGCCYKSLRGGNGGSRIFDSAEIIRDLGEIKPKND